MIEAAFSIGILPHFFWDMELWEFNACVRAYNKKRQQDDQGGFVRVWQTANLVGAAFAGKLKPLKHYLEQDAKKVGQKLTREEMDAFDERLKNLMNNG